MAIKYDKVIVFGPTGAVGGAAAVEAHKRGAEIWLAMRDPTKPIPAFGKGKEKAEAEEKARGQNGGSYHRIKADLSDANSVKEAVKKSKAKAAFVYLVHTPDGLKSTVLALKEAGIEYVVFLSSFTVPHDKDIRAIEPKDLIPFGHAQVEISLEDLGIAHAALRPAQFASNTFNLSLDQSKQPWEAWVLRPDYKGDGIAPRDIGRVGGSVLVEPPFSFSFSSSSSSSNGSAKEIIYLCGPNILTADQQWDIIKKVSGKEVKIVRPTKEEYTQFLSSRLPPPLANYLISWQESVVKDEVYTGPFYSQRVANIKKYSGYEPTSFEEFVASYTF